MTKGITTPSTTKKREYFKFSKISDGKYRHRIEYSNMTIEVPGFPDVISELCNLYLSSLYDSNEYDFKGLDTSEVADSEAQAIRSVVCLIEYSKSLENIIKRINKEATTTTSKIKELHINASNKLNNLNHFYLDYKKQRDIK